MNQKLMLAVVHLDPLIGAGTFSTICSKISSIPIPAFADANTASDASKPITSSISCELVLDQHLVNQFY